ncbi:MAG TPA: hypothetical protein VKG84_11390 [Candidatus Acidoferrales bacterium]|nr:hypothetical protein [Candidatus Acidoferrales bacterium]
MILASFILVISIALLMQFFVSYCRLQVAAGRRVELSDSAREATGIQGQGVSGDEFLRLRRLVELCPETNGDTYKLGAIHAYHAFLGMVQMLFGPVVPGAAAWATNERAGCSYYAAVALDARIMQTRRIYENDFLAS